MTCLPAVEVREDVPPSLEVEILRVPAEFESSEGEARLEIRLAGGTVLQPGDRMRAWLDVGSMDEDAPPVTGGGEHWRRMFSDFGEIDPVSNEAHIQARPPPQPRSASPSRSARGNSPRACATPPLSTLPPIPHSEVA